MTHSFNYLDRIEIAPNAQAESLFDEDRLIAGDYVRLTIEFLSGEKSKTRVIIGGIEKIVTRTNGYIEITAHEENGILQFRDDIEEFPRKKVLLHRKHSTLTIEIISKVLCPDEPIPF